MGMAGYYGQFCPNFSDVAEPLTNRFKKKVKYIWADPCQHALQKIKALLMSSLVLVAPNFQKPLKIQVDASDIGCGSVLLQENAERVDQPVCYFSKKFNKHQRNYSTVEKECLALILSLKHFDVYVNSPAHPVTVYTDHNPLVNKMRNSNKKLLRRALTL